VRPAAVIALLSAGAAGAAAGGRLLSAQPVAGADSTVVQLEADQPLSFTTLKLASPPRVVVDFAETTVAGVPAAQDVDDGAVRRIAVATAGAHTARVVIELVTDVDFDVRAAGTRVEVRIPRPRPVARKAAPEPPAEDAPVATAPPTASGAANATAAETVSPTSVAVSTETASPSPTPAAPNDAAMAARAVPPTVAASPPPAPAPVAAPSPAAPVADTAAAEPAPTQTPGPATAEAQERAALPTVALVGSRRPEPTAVAAPERKPQSPPRGKRPAITGIGFRPDAGGEVLVRSDRPLQYGVSSSDRVVLLHLPDTAIPVANNRRPLDTRFFGGTVQRIVPHEVKGGTEVRIELREPAEVHLNQSGSLLTVTFTPGS
jgi:hypothetical protein